MNTSAAERKARRLAEREERIVTAARALAEDQGWEAVTTRRLSDAIGYSQPVLYSHFPEGRSQIVTAVALDGMVELAAAMVATTAPTPGRARAGAEGVRALAMTYLDFAERHPATYEAMFRLPIGVPFASAETPRPLREAFNAIVTTLRGLDRPPADLETAAEVLWGAVHGVATLQRAARFSPGNQERRIEELVRHFTD